MSESIFQKVNEYCLSNQGDIFDLKIVYKESLSEYSFSSVKRCVHKLAHQKKLVHLMKEVYFIGSKVPDDIKDILIKYYLKHMNIEEEPAEPVRAFNYRNLQECKELETNRNSFGEDTYFNKKRLSLIIKARELDWPRTNAFHIVLFSLILIASLVGISLGVYFIPVPVLAKIFICVFSYALFLEFYLRFFFIQIVKCYQHYASEETRRKCVCMPSCSEYTIDTFKKYELIVAIIRVRKRLFKVCRGENYQINLP